MIKVLCLAVFSCFLLVISCKNKSSDAGLQPDSTKVIPPAAKAQDSSSLTDTGYRIGDTVR